MSRPRLTSNSYHPRTQLSRFVRPVDGFCDVGEGGERRDGRLALFDLFFVCFGKGGGHVCVFVRALHDLILKKKERKRKGIKGQGRERKLDETHYDS